jgi:putative addiction module component (TIGR02574 family)
MNAEQLAQEALNLAPEDRAKLAGRLLSSLDPGDEESISDEEWCEAWGIECARRLAELEADPSLGTPAEEVLRRARARLE